MRNVPALRSYAHTRVGTLSYPPRAQPMTSIGILHFTDVHLGLSGFDDSWPSVTQELVRDLASSMT